MKRKVLVGVSVVAMGWAAMQVSTAQEPGAATSLPAAGAEEGHDPFHVVDSNKALTARRARLKARLGKEVTVELGGVSLSAAIDALQKQAGGQLHLDEAALARLRLSPDTTVTLKLRDVTLETALERLVGQIGLTFVTDVKNERLVITDWAGVTEFIEVRVYDVRDLIMAAVPVPAAPLPPGENAPVDREKSDAAIKALADLITKTVTPGRWTRNDPKGIRMDTFRGEMLVIRHTPRHHDRIWQLLSGLRDLFADKKQQERIGIVIE